MQQTTLAELLDAQENNRACILAALIIGLLKSMFTFDTEPALVRVLPINGASQPYIPTTMQPCILHLCHYSLLVGHPGKRPIYDNIRQHFYCSHMTNNVYTTVARCLLRTRNRRPNKKESKLRLFSPVYSLDFVAIDLLGYLPKSKEGNKYIAEIMYRYLKLAKLFQQRARWPKGLSVSSWNIEWTIPEYHLQY